MTRPMNNQQGQAAALHLQNLMAQALPSAQGKGGPIPRDRTIQPNWAGTKGGNTPIRKPAMEQGGALHHGPKGGGGKRKGGGGGIMNRIRQINQTQTQALLHQLQMQNQQNHQNMLQDMSKTNDQYIAGRGDMNYVHGQVRDYLGHMRSQMNDDFRGRRQITQGLGNDLVNQIDTGSDAARQAAMAEQARLGIQQSGMGQFDQDANNNMMVARQGNTDVQENLGLDQRGANNVAALLAGMNQGSRQSIMGQLRNTKNTGINDLRNAFNDAHLQIQGQTQQVRMEQAAQLQQMLLQQMQQMQQFRQQRSLYNSQNSGYSSGGSGDGSDFTSDDTKYIKKPLNKIAQSKELRRFLKAAQHPPVIGPWMYDPNGERGPSTVDLSIGRAP